MIEFNGYISDATEKYFFKKSKKIVLITLLVVWGLLLPGVLMLNTIITQFNIFFLFNIVFFIFLLCICLPKTNKQKKKILPHKIVIIDDTIVCSAEAYTESKLITDVKFVRDFGDFYELVFPFGKISEKFLCQKNLIQKGTIDDFKRLFNGKIIPMQ